MSERLAPKPNPTPVASPADGERKGSPLLRYPGLAHARYEPEEQPSTFAPRSSKQTDAAKRKVSTTNASEGFKSPQLTPAFSRETEPPKKSPPQRFGAASDSRVTPPVYPATLPAKPQAVPAKGRNDDFSLRPTPAHLRLSNASPSQKAARLTPAITMSRALPSEVTPSRRESPQSAPCYKEWPTRSQPNLSEAQSRMPSSRPTVPPAHYPQFGTRATTEVSREPMKEENRWPALLSDSSDEPLDEWLGRQREQQHRDRLEAEQRGNAWTA